MSLEVDLPLVKPSDETEACLIPWLAKLFPGSWFTETGDNKYLSAAAML